jgi:hypothetical protein
LVVLDGGLDQPPDFLLAEPEKKSGPCIMKCRPQCLTFQPEKLVLTRLWRFSACWCRRVPPLARHT